MIYDCFRMIGQAFNLAWSIFVRILETSGMTIAVFIGFIVSMLLLKMFIAGLKSKTGSADNVKGGK